MPFKASTAQDKNALPAVHTRHRVSGLVQRFLSMVEGLKTIGVELLDQILNAVAVAR